MYIEPWHADIMDFLDLRKNHGKEEMRARDLFYAMWMNDLFMQRVQKDQIWSLMCPNECRGLTEAYAEDFTRLYESYESQGKFRKQIKARDLWSAICTAQIETGTPYMLYKDSINVKSNQKNLGTIKSSNLCLTGDTSITVKDVNGDISDINLIDVIERVKSGEVLETLSKNIDTDLSEFKKILNAALTNDSASLIKITDTTSGKSIECTYEHKIYTKNRGYVEAQFLEETDILDIIQ